MLAQHRQINLPLILVICLVLLSCGSAEESELKHLESGKRFLAEKDYARAGIELKNVLKLDPKSVDAYLLFGRLELEKLNTATAASYFSKVLELDPNNYKARLELSKIYISVSLSDKAKDTIAPILKNTPNDPAAKTVTAAILFQKGDLDKALSRALEALKDDPSQVEAAALAANIYKTKGDLGRTIDLLAKATANDPKAYQLRVALANIYDERKDFDKAAEILSENILIDPKSMEHRKDLASYYAHIKQPAKSEVVINDAIKNDPKNPDGYLMLADFLATYKRPAEAEKELLSAIDAYPLEFSLRFGLANYYQSINKRDKAKVVYLKIIDLEKIEPEGIKARKELAEMFLAEGLTADALKLADEILKSNETDSEALLIRSRIELSGDKPNLQAAIADLRVILKGQADSPAVLTMLARAHNLNHEPDLAREALEQAVAIAPNDANANVQLAAFVWGIDHKIDSAERILDKFLSISPSDALALQAKLEILLARDDGDRILETLATLKKDHPDLSVGFYRSGEYYFSKARYLDALREYEIARDKSKGDFAAVGAIARTYGKLKDFDRALKILDEYLSISPKNIDALQMKASLLASRNDKAGLFKVIAQAKQFYPDNPISENWAGEYYLGQNNFAEARRIFTAASEKAPNDPRYIRAITASYIAEKKPDDALAWLAQLSRSKPDNALVPYLIGKILLSQDKYLESRMQFQVAMQLLPRFDQVNMPKRSEIYMRLADTHFLQNNPDKGIATLKEGLIAAPHDNSLLLKLASAYQKQGGANDAIAIYEEMLDRDSANILVKNNLASLLTDKGDGPSLDRARRLAHSFDSSEDPILLDTLGWIYCKQNELGFAIPLLKKASESAPDSIVLQYHLGMAYYMKGDKAAAKKYLKQSLSTNAQYAGEDNARSALKTLD